MAVDAYMYFKDYNGKFLKSESQVQHSDPGNKDVMFKAFGFDKALSDGGIFEVEDYSFDIEQTLNIGSQGGGAGAGKVTFNPFSINRKIDKSSPIIFQNACAGTPFKDVRLALRKSAGADMSGIIFVVFCFKLVAVKTIAWSHDDESPKEACTFEYGGLQVYYRPQNPDGSLADQIAGGWNRVRNVKDDVVDSDLIGSQLK